jgi:DNA-directed RNA polymerase subunit RPC12/RpoP
MSDLKSYTCAKCGAVLSVDKLEGQMACPFCGNEFDYVDFHRDELLLQAEECLSRGAYEPAKEKFNKVLENDPTDIVAYRGLILCAGKVQSTNDMRDRYDQVSSDLNAIYKIVASAKEHVTQEDAEYLDNLVCLFEIPKVYKNIRTRKENTVVLEKKRDLQLEVNNERDDIIARAILISIVVLMGLLVLLAASINDVDIEGFGHIILLAPIIGIVALIVFLYKKFSTDVVNIPDRSSSLSDKMEYVEEKHLEIFNEVLEYEAGFKNRPKKKVLKRAAKKKETEAAAEATESAIICAKCGGFLSLSSARQFYECNSCGVSYGKYLFFGDLMANAVKAMNMGEFDEADQILSHRLTADPKDFDALFGRFLCAGKWKSLKDIDINDKMFMLHVRKLKGQLDAIEKRISQEDQPLWKDIRAFSELLAEYSVRRHAFDRVHEKYQSVSGKLTNTFLMDEEIKDYKRQEGELWEQVTSLEGECDEIKVRIEEAVKVLTDAESKCVFFDLE